MTAKQTQQSESPIQIVLGIPRDPNAPYRLYARRFHEQDTPFIHVDFAGTPNWGDAGKTVDALVETFGTKCRIRSHTPDIELAELDEGYNASEYPRDLVEMYRIMLRAFH